MIVRVRLLLAFTSFAICKWSHVACGNGQRLDWSIYEKLQTIQIGLIQNTNLDKYKDLSKYSVDDNKVLINDRTKVQRSYNTERCIKDLGTIQKVSNDEKSNWAIEMLGAWGKLSSVGISAEYGNFDRCHDLEVNKSMNIETQYCLADIDTEKSNVTIFTPTIQRVGICIPNSCAPSLVAIILTDFLDAKKSIQINIAANHCSFKNDNTTMFFSYKCFIAFLAMVFGFVILSSIYDVIYTVRKEQKNPMWLAFSAYSNGKILFACKSDRSPKFMPCLDGMRVISALWIVTVHLASLSLSITINPSYNAPVAKCLNRIFIAGRFSVDTFLVMSAMLAVNKMLHEFSKYGRLNIPLLYLQRILRLSPVMIVITLFQRYLLQFCVNGPGYTHEIDDIRNTCEHHPWYSLLYSSNYFLIQCVLGSWYLATDMQLYLLTPFMVLLSQHYPKLSTCFSFVIILIDSIVAWNNGRLWLDDYFATRSRITPWLIGVMFAYLLFKMCSEKPIRIPKYLNIFLLTSSVSVILMLVYFSAFVEQSNGFLYKARLWWSLSLCYMIFACLNDQGGIINWFLSQPGWQPLSRLSFNMYLVHQTVMAVIFADQKVGWYFSAFTQIQTLFVVVSISFAVAVVLALIIEMPIINLSHICLSKKENPVNLEYNLIPSLDTQSGESSSCSENTN